MARGRRLSEEPVVAILRKHVWRWVLRPLLGLVALWALFVGVLFFYGTYSHHLPRVWMGMGPLGFEQTKARRLDPQVRQAYEQELFEELALWKTVSKRFPDGEDMQSFLSAKCARDQRWKVMAKEGFELAHIARQVQNPCGNMVFSSKGPMRRLQRLAEGGDVAAMCMMGSIDDPRQDLGPLAQVRSEMVERGAALGHLSRWTYPGLDGDPQAVAQSLSLAARAVEGGAYRAAGVPLRHFRRLSRQDPSFDERAYCWSQVFNRSQTAIDWVAETHQSILVTARSREDQARVDRLRTMSLRLMSTEDCVSMGWN